jgi:hypothetical protein
MERIIEQIEQIEADVRNNWLAGDGGLTMSASDVLSLAAAIVERIEDRDWEGLKEYDPFDSSNGAENELNCLAIEAGQAIYRRLHHV